MISRHDLIILAISGLAWAVFGYWPPFHALAFWIFPPVACSALTVLIVCNLLEAKKVVRPVLALIPPAVVLPLAVVELNKADWSGPLVVGLLIYPALATALAYLVYAVVSRVRANNSSKPTPLRGVDKGS